MVSFCRSTCLLTFGRRSQEQGPRTGLIRKQLKTTKPQFYTTEVLALLTICQSFAQHIAMATVADGNAVTVFVLKSLAVESWICLEISLDVQFVSLEVESLHEFRPVEPWESRWCVALMDDLSGEVAADMAACNSPFTLLQN
ncbi:hypothetical protein Bbelb_095860 [Branchiostoma belcheri]|nr:hypothetical protein Bbelb_095860 [Branchiostoma belcheri]